MQAGWLAGCGGEERRRDVMHGTKCSDAHYRYLCPVVQVCVGGQDLAYRQRRGGVFQVGVVLGGGV